MKKKLMVASLLVALIVVGVAVYPPPKPALAVGRYVQITANWNGFSNRNIHVVATLLDVNLNPINSQALSPDPNFSVWNGTIQDGGVTPTTVVFTWDYDNSQLGADWQMTWLNSGNDCRGTIIVAAVDTGTYCTVVREWD